MSVSLWPFLVVTGVIFGSLHPVLINLGKDEEGLIPFSSASVAFCIEFAKLLTSLTFTAREWIAHGRLVRLPKYAILLCALPAVLYTVVNNLVTHAQKFMDPSSFQIMNNLKIISIALLYKLIIKKKISRQKWISITMLFLGGTVNSLGGLQKAASSSTSSSKEIFITWTGIVLVCVYCFASGLAGVYTEAVLKKYRQTSINLQNAALYSFGLLTNALVYFMSRTGSRDLQEVKDSRDQDFFRGFTKYTWLIIITQTLNGLIISIIMKYLSNIVRLFMIASSMILTTVLSYVIFGYNVDVYFAFAFLMVISALFLYHSDDGKDGSDTPNVGRKFRTTKHV